MMRMIVLSMVFLGVLYANTAIELKKGWQLVGIPTVLRDMSVFDTKYVEIVWGFDGASQEWRGYSPDANISATIEKNALKRLEHLEAWQAVWVFSSDNWKLTLDDAPTLPSAAQNNVIHLYKGWNLVEVPQQSVVSDGFFGDTVVWKYSADQQWKVNDASLNFPSIEAITASEGLWVKSETTRTVTIENSLSKLHTFRDRTSMLSYIHKMLQMQNYYADTLLELPSIPVTLDSQVLSSEGNQEGSHSANDVTTTNLQEAGVDEGDILKHNGTHLFSADNSNGRIIVTAFNKLIAQDYKPITFIDMNGKNVIAMYVQEHRLAVLSNTAYYYIDTVAETTARSSIVYDPNQTFTFEIFDISDINAIKKVASHEIEGSYETSRLIDGNVFLVSRFMPSIRYEYPKKYVDTICVSIIPDAGMQCACSAETLTSPNDPPLPPQPNALTQECNYDVNAWNANSCNEYEYDDKGAWKYDYDNPIVLSEHLTPILSGNGARRELVAPSTLYAPYKLDQRANITTISSFNMDDGTYRQSLSFLGNTNNYYASATALYLASSEYPMFVDFTHAKEQATIYKFRLGEDLVYEGRGSVEGWMLNQFSMSEYEGYLRVATTVGQSWWNRQTNNSVYILKDVNKTLQIEGVVSGLGKEGETIHAVRFMGDRGFVVTFERTDPLYTLDLSDPKNPKKVGELFIPGFSRYLHVVDANRLLSIGRHADDDGRQQELQVQLFDISDFANPRLVDRVQVGSTGSYSEAEYNHKAFTYRASDLMFGLPFQNYETGIHKASSEHFGIYQIEGMTIHTIGTLTSGNGEWGSVGRGIIFDADTHTYATLIKGADMMCERIR